MSRGFFNPSIPVHPPPDTEVNWAMLAQRWMYENGSNEPSYPNSGNNYRNQGLPPPQSQQQQYGSFFMSPPTAVTRPPPPSFPPGGFPPRMHHPGPPLGYNQPSFGPPPPVPLSTYGNPYASNSWTNTVGNEFINEPPKPLFQSHAREATRSNIPSSYSQKEDDSETFGAMPHWLNGVNVDDPSIANWMNMGDWSEFDPNVVIDQQARKKLPTWLLEGLEKAEKEKKHNEEKNQKLAEQELEEQRREKRRKDKGLGKFDSDSEDEDASSSSTKLESRPTFAEQSQIGRKRKIREVDDREYKENQMAAIKRLVTNVLLDSTDSAISELCHRVLNKARSKAKPQIITKSSALAALGSIVDYDEDSSSEDE